MIRFFNKIDFTETCWLWTAANNGKYGRFVVRGKNVPAHRVSYEMMVADIPPGRDIDHLCRTTLCANPEHLEAVTRKVNLRRGKHYLGDRTHCKYGHEFSEDNTYLTPEGARSCRICRRRYQANWIERDPDRARRLSNQRTKRYYKHKKEG